MRHKNSIGEEVTEFFFDEVKSWGFFEIFFLNAGEFEDGGVDAAFRVNEGLKSFDDGIVFDNNDGSFNHAVGGKTSASGFEVDESEAMV